MTSTRIEQIPPSLSFDQAASIPVALSAAVFGLYGTKVQQGGAALTAPWKAGGLGKYADQAIVVFGGASSVGQYGAFFFNVDVDMNSRNVCLPIVIQLAKLSGFNPIITTASPHNHPYLVSLGATHTHDRTQPISHLTSLLSSPPSVVYDAVSSPATQQAAYDLLVPGGTLVTVMPDAVARKGQTEGEGEGKTVVATYATVHGDVNREVGEEMYGCLEGLLERGDIKVRALCLSVSLCLSLSLSVSLCLSVSLSLFSRPINFPRIYAHTLSLRRSKLADRSEWFSFCSSPTRWNTSLVG